MTQSNTPEKGAPPAVPESGKDAEKEDLENEFRREALKKFGRYAAAAPTAMLLLTPRQGDAHHKAWHNPPGHAKRGGPPGHAKRGGRGGGYH